MAKHAESPADTHITLPLRFPMNSPRKNITLFRIVANKYALEALWTTSKQKITKLSLLQRHNLTLVFERI